MFMSIFFSFFATGHFSKSLILQSFYNILHSFILLTGHFLGFFEKFLKFNYKKLVKSKIILKSAQ